MSLYVDFPPRAKGLNDGSRGLLFAQIRNGAPFDVFLSADTARPAAQADTSQALQLRTYAVGRLAVVGRDDALAQALAVPRIALANPKVAPYGLAGEEVLTALTLSPQRVYGENVGQAASFFLTGQVPVALDSLSYALGPLADTPQTTVPADLHAPIRQAAVLLPASPAARAFWDYLFSPEAQAQLIAAGYESPAP